MTAAAPEPRSEAQTLGRTRSAIWAALFSEEREEFDRDLDTVIAQALDESRVDPLREVLDHWRLTAIAAVTNPLAHRRMLDKAAEYDRTGQVTDDGPGRHCGSWDQLKAELGW